jgi:hypothetical protein
MDNFMIWVETYLTYENLVAAANVIATVSIGAALIYNKLQQTKMTLLKNTDIVNNVNKTIQPVLSRVVTQSLGKIESDMQQLHAENRKLLQATVLALTNDAESRLAAIKLLGEVENMPQPVVVKAEQLVATQIEEQKQAVEAEEQKTEKIDEQIDEIINTL